LVESRRPGDMLGLSIVACFGLGGWNVADRFEQAPVAEPVHPFQGGGFDGLQAAPWPAAADHFGLVEAIDRLGQGVDAPIKVKGPIEQPETVSVGHTGSRVLSGFAPTYQM
jgi:hypothetical protein